MIRSFEIETAESIDKLDEAVESSTKSLNYNIDLFGSYEEQSTYSLAMAEKDNEDFEILLEIARLLRYAAKREEELIQIDFIENFF